MAKQTKKSASTEALKKSPKKKLVTAEQLRTEENIFDPGYTDDDEAPAKSNKTKVSVQASDIDYDPELYVSNPHKVTEQKQIVHRSHVFKLHVSKVIKNTGLYEKEYTVESPEFMKFEHTHILRTRDSDGRQPKAILQLSSRPNHVTLRTNSIASHFHLVEIEEFPNDPTKAPVVRAVSGPMHLVRKKIKGSKKTQLTEELVNDYDEHKHKVEYIRSDRVAQRIKNMDAAQVATNLANLGKAPEGAIEG